jgi:hypothetical protein
MPTTRDLESCTSSRFQEVEAFKSQGSTKIGDAATSGWVEKTEPGQRHLCRLSALAGQPTPCACRSVLYVSILVASCTHQTTKQMQLARRIKDLPS